MPRFLASRAWMVAALVATTAACARGSTQGGRPGSNSDVIYRDEIARTNALTAYDAVRRLRPAFLTGRGPTTLLAAHEGSSAPVVYLDDHRFGDISSLRNIPVDNIVEIRLLSAAQAQVRWGMDHPSGAILVLTGVPRGPSP